MHNSPEEGPVWKLALLGSICVKVGHQLLVFSKRTEYQLDRELWLGGNMKLAYLVVQYNVAITSQYLLHEL